MTELAGMRLLIVDDNATNVALVEQILARAGYANLTSTRDPTAVASLCRALVPDLLLLDLHMPHHSGFDVLRELQDLIADPESLPVLVLTADASTDARHQALAMGARDFITKPIDQTELLLRVRNLLSTRHLQRQLQDRNLILDQAVQLRTTELEQARLESLSVLATMAEYHDYTTANHTQRVGRMAALIARQLGLSEQFVNDLRDAAPLHDVGKVGISDLILLKPRRLTVRERSTMMRHVEIGARILESARSPVLSLAAEVARTHHERWDGNGYLAGLSGEEIPLAGRITAVADVFDALTHERPYKVAWSPERALSEIRLQSGMQFDPQVVEAFCALDPGSLPARELPATGANTAGVLEATLADIGRRQQPAQRVA